MKTIFGVEKKNFIIYLIGLGISIVLISLYFINKDNALCIVSCSIGSSLIGAIVLAYFIDLSNMMNEQKRIQNFRKEKLNIIKQYLIRLLEITFRKYFLINRNRLEKQKKYAIKYEDIKDFLIKSFTEKDIIYQSSFGYPERDLEFKRCFEGYSWFDTVVLYINKILSQQDILILNKIFTYEEIYLLQSITITFPVINNDSFESSIYNVTFIINQLIEINELSFLKNSYGVYDLKTNHLSMCDKKGNAINRPLNIDFNITEVITNGKALLKGEKDEI